MPLKRKITVLLAKIEASYGMATGVGSTTTIVDANETWAADGVAVGDTVVYKPDTVNQEISRIASFDTGTNTITLVSELPLAGATADGDLYEVMVAGGLAANEQDMDISATADAASNATTLIDAALNATDGFAHQGIKVGHQVYVVSGGGVGNSGVITNIDHANDTLTVTTITGLTTASVCSIRPTPVLLFDVGHKFDIELHERSPMRETLTRLKSFLGKRQSVVTANLELAGGTSAANFAAGTPGAGVLPAYDSLIKSCGFSPTIVAATSVTYNTISVGIPALTIITYEDGIAKTSLGCRGTATFELVTGMPAMMNFTISGIPKETASSLIADTSLPPGVIYPGIEPPQCMGVTLNAYAYILDTISIDLGNTVAYRPSMAAVAGLISTILTDRQITGSFDPEMVRKADHDFYALMIAGTLVEVNVVAGATAGNVVQIGSPDGVASAQYTEVDSDQERELARVAATNLAFVSTTAENAFAIKIT